VSENQREGRSRPDGKQLIPEPTSLSALREQSAQPRPQGSARAIRTPRRSSRRESSHANTGVPRAGTVIPMVNGGQRARAELWALPDYEDVVSDARAITLRFDRRVPPADAASELEQIAQSLATSGSSDRLSRCRGRRPAQGAGTLLHLLVESDVGGSRGRFLRFATTTSGEAGAGRG
jgi:hypothetical protein